MRKRFRFRLRFLLVLATCVCLAAIFYRYHARQREAEQKALAAIDRLNELGQIDDTGTTSDIPWVGRVMYESLIWSSVNNLLVQCGCDVFDRVSTITLDGDGFDDRVVSRLVVFRSLKKLTLIETRISRDGLQRLRSKLPNATIKYVDARDLAIRSPIKTRILFLAKDGARVQQGDLLVKLDTSRLDDDRRLLRTEIENDKSDNDLIDELTAQESQLERLENLQQACTIRAPMSGTVRYPARGGIELGAVVRERQCIIILEPDDSMTTH